MKKRNKLLLILSLVAFIAVISGVSYAYFVANITGKETASTLVIKAGTLSIVYSSGDTVTATGIIPSNEPWATKTFRVTGNNNTELSMSYYVTITVTTNTFSDGAIQFTLEGTNTSNNGSLIADIPMTPINGTTTYTTTTGLFNTGSNLYHDYTLNFYFPETGIDQSEDMQKAFVARVGIGSDEAYKDVPQHWTSATSGTLLYAMKNDSNNVISDTTWTIPGKQVSGVGNTSTFSISVGSSYRNYYWTYADSYSLDSSTGKFNLTGVHTGQFSSIYNSLPGKYIVGTSYSANSNSGNTAKTTTALTNLYMVDRVTYNSSGTSYVYYRKMAYWGQVATAYQSYYWTYGTGVTADTTNGSAATTKYQLTGVNTALYSTNKADLVGKYIISNSAGSNGNASDTPKPTNNLTYVYKVLAVGTDYFVYEEPAEAVLTTTEDDYGTSYYYRGAVTNNYVKFANMCWRIVRITGDGNIKMVLYNYNSNSVSNPCALSEDGTDKAFARYSGTTFQGGFKASPYNDNTYAGFMYGTAGSSTYEATHSNTTDTTILTNLKAWYDAKFSTVQKDLLADVIWCNDKSLASSSYNPDSWTGTINTGVGTVSTNYKTRERIYPVDSANPSLICPDASTSNNDYKKISKFTAADTINGNGALNGYKIGLLTSDELAFAGSKYQVANSAFYLYKNATSTNWWLLSPHYYSSGVYIAAVSNSGYTFQLVAGGSYAVRPAIALKYDVTVTGSGTQADPYVVSES